MKKLLLSNIKAQAEGIRIDRDGVIKRLQGSLITLQRANKSDSLKRQRELEGRIHSIETQAENLYENKVVGAVSNDDFTRLSQRFEKEHQEKSAQLAFLQQSSAEVKQKLYDIDKWVKLIEECSVLDHVDGNLLETLIDKIEIGRKEIVNGIKAQEVRIFYKYVGLV